MQTTLPTGWSIWSGEEGVLGEWIEARSSLEIGRFRGVLCFGSHNETWRGSSRHIVEGVEGVVGVEGIEGIVVGVRESDRRLSTRPGVVGEGSDIISTYTMSPSIARLR